MTLKCDDCINRNDCESRHAVERVNTRVAMFDAILKENKVTFSMKCKYYEMFGASPNNPT